jgi:hypothetical protein
MNQMMVDMIVDEITPKLLEIPHKFGEQKVVVKMVVLIDGVKKEISYQ